jgi:hypothetical protein
MPRHVARLVIDYFAYVARLGASACRTTYRDTRRRLLRLRSCIRVPRAIARLVVDYFAYIACQGASAHRVAHRDYLSRGNTGSTSSTPRAAATSSFGRITSTIHVD